MRVSDNSTTKFEHFFVQGYRADPAGAGGAGTDTEKVGALVIKQAVDSAGAIKNDREVLLTDELYDPADLEDPDTANLIRFESEIAVTKPHLDVVVVASKAATPEETPGALAFGNAQVSRASGPNDAPILGLAFGWRSRSDDPVRAPLAGNAGAFTPDPERPEKLPPGFSNSFFNGSRVANVRRLGTGDSVLFIEIDADGVTPTGVEFGVDIPPAPRLTFTRDGAALDPQPTLEYTVDTVVLDRSALEATFTWRAVFPWSDAYELAVLEIDDHG